MPKPAIKKTIQGIYEATFSEVGDQFLDVLVEEIAILFNVQTVMIHRLLSAKEFRDMKHSEGCPSIQLIKTPNAHLSADEQYLFIKACHSTLPQQPALTKYSAVALSSFPDNSPHIKTLEDVTHYVTQDASLSGTVYPSYSSFVGLRLDLDSREPIGLISIMHDKPLEKQQLDHIACILKAVQRRVTNEISRLRQRDNLIVIKNAALQDAEYKLRFLADMSHEIRTPLNAVVALTDLLLQEKQSLNEEQVEHLQVIQTSGNHLLTVINDILDFSKMNHGSKFKLEYRKFSLRKCIKDALNMARHQAANSQYPKQIHIVECPLEIKDDIPVPQLLQQLEASGILAHKHGTNQQTSLPFIWKVDPDIPDYLMGDSMRLTQILINLCSNAAKFTKQGGIHVKISKPDTDKSNFRERYDARVESVYQKYAMRRRKKAPIVPSSDSSDSCYYYETEDEQTVPQEDQNGRVVLEISVTDTGIGMPASRLPLLFKSFSQIDISTARKYGGTGLGLAISSMLVNRMGGGLWVESEEGVGSRFALTLPIAIAQDIPTSPSSSISSTESLCTPQPSEPIAQSTIQTNIHSHSHNLQHNNIPDTKSTASGLQSMISKTHRPETVPKKVQQEENLALEHPIKVLLAEDNILNQKIALSILKRLGYQDVTIASNGKEALDLIIKQEFDVIFMDLYMPEMDGLEATRHIRQELKKNVYIIALTASASKQDRNICIEAGMNDFISKPFTMTEMKAALRKVYTTK